MSSIRKIIDDVYKKLKSKKSKKRLPESAKKASVKTKSKSAKGEKRFSKKPVDPAEQRYKQRRSIERHDWHDYDDEMPDLNDWPDTKREENKSYIKKSRNKKVTKDDINRRINHKRIGEYRRHEFDEDIPF